MSHINFGHLHTSSLVPNHSTTSSSSQTCRKKPVKNLSQKNFNNQKIKAHKPEKTDLAQHLDHARRKVLGVPGHLRHSYTVAGKSGLSIPEKHLLLHQRRMIYQLNEIMERFEASKNQKEECLQQI